VERGIFSAAAAAVARPFALPPSRSASAWTGGDSTWYGEANPRAHDLRLQRDVRAARLGPGGVDGDQDRLGPSARERDTELTLNALARAQIPRRRARRHRALRGLRPAAVNRWGGGWVGTHARELPIAHIRGDSLYLGGLAGSLCHTSGWPTAKLVAALDVLVMAMERLCTVWAVILPGITTEGG
jgi:hypothetical protein